MQCPCQYCRMTCGWTKRTFQGRHRGPGEGGGGAYRPLGSHTMRMIIFHMTQTSRILFTWLPIATIQDQDLQIVQKQRQGQVGGCNLHISGPSTDQYSVDIGREQIPDCDALHPLGGEYHRANKRQRRSDKMRNLVDEVYCLRRSGYFAILGTNIGLIKGQRRAEFWRKDSQEVQRCIFTGGEGEGGEGVNLPVRGVLHRLVSLKTAWKGAWEMQVVYQRVTHAYFFLCASSKSCHAQHSTISFAP